MPRITTHSRRLPLLLLSLAMLLLAATGTGRAAPAKQSTAPPTKPPSFMPGIAEGFTGDLPALKKRHLIRVATTYSQTNFFVVEGRPRGFEYSLIKEYETWLNRKIPRKKGLRVELLVQPLANNDLIPSILEGRADIAAAGLTITRQRSAQVAFTIPYLTGIDELVVTNRKSKGIKTLDDLANRQILVRRSSSYYQSLLRLNARLEKKGLKPVRILPADENLVTEDILEMVNAGIAKITVVDSHLANLWAQVLPNITVHRKLILRRGGKLAWIVRKQNPKLLASLNRFLKHHRKGTLKGNIYFKRYFKNTKWIKNPLDPKASRRLQRYARWFKKYSRRYKIDWVLAAALAYQESRLDNSVRSAAGAIGLMQLLPSLGKDHRIQINHLERPENNIHAGIKYLALLRDTYFNDPKLKPIERVRFALASYNAGPNRINGLRRRAAKMGYDPNRWFFNVEVVAQRYVGRETVRYVRNIHKYYVAYKLSQRQLRYRKKERFAD